MDLSSALEELYSRPLGEFVATRDDLAKRLAGSGDKEAAATLRKRKKPVVAAWAMNQVARLAADDLAELFRVVGAMAEATDTHELRTLSQQRNKLVQSLAESAEAILEEEGHAGGVEQQISMTLLGATDAEVQQGLRAGHLAQLPETSGGGWGLAALPEDAVEDDDGRAERAAAAERAERDAVEAERELRDRERALADARAALANAEKTVERARGAAEKARDAAEELKAAL